MNSRPLLIGSVIGIFVLAAAATVFVGVRLVSRVASGMGFGGFSGGGYYGINSTANRYVRQGDYISAIAEYDKMVAMRPNKQDGYLLRAMAEFHARQFKRAIRDNTTALNLLKTRAGIDELGFNPNASYQTKLRMVPTCQASLYFNRAVVYDNLNDLPHAIADYSADLAIHPDETDARHYRALAYLGTKQYALGIADCSYNIDLHPRRPANYFTRAQIYAAKGDGARAEADYTKALDFDPSNSEYSSELSQFYEKNRQFAKQEELWKGMKENAPNNSDAWGNYGWAQYLNGHIAQAIVSNQRALQLDPSQAYTKFNLALCYSVTDRWAEAEPLYRQAIALHVTESQKGGLQDIRNALKTHPDSQALRKAEALLGGS